MSENLKKELHIDYDLYIKEHEKGQIAAEHKGRNDGKNRIIRSFENMERMLDNPLELTNLERKEYIMLREVYSWVLNLPGLSKIMKEGPPRVH